MTKIVYAIIGLFVGAAVNILLNLLSAAISQKLFSDQFSQQSIWWLVAFAIIGLLIGQWLGNKITLPVAETRQRTIERNSRPVTMTRLMALLSYGKLRGKGIQLKDILLVGSRIDIDTND
ncbi:MAG: hypothetical protein QNJ55_17420 [Xenococcus sp. MO_188.B8]|nr:hypothetical protein [Xenococcus sp. MO_188.B8]